MMNVIDLFAGCGGLSLGAARVGLAPRLAIELDERAAASHTQNFPGCVTKRLDISMTNASQIREIAGDRIDLIIGGPPCQGFSVMGKNNENDPRNALLDHFFRLVAELRPRAFLMENVPGLMSARNRWRLERAIQPVSSTYELAEPIILNASNLGAATIRKRVIVAGFDPERMDPFDFEELSQRRADGVPVAAALSGLPEPGETDLIAVTKSNSEYVTRINRMVDGVGNYERMQDFLEGILSGFVATSHSKEVENRFKLTPPGSTEKKSRLFRLSPTDTARTLRAGTGPERGSFQSARPIHPKSPRVISVREAARIQGFPDWFEFDSTKWHSHRMIGNSVSPIFAEEILKPIAVALGALPAHSERGSTILSAPTDNLALETLK